MYGPSSVRQRNFIYMIHHRPASETSYVWAIIIHPTKCHLYGPSSAGQRNVICMGHHRPPNETPFILTIIGPPGKRYLNVNSVKLASLKVALFQGAQQPRLSVQEVGRDTRTVATILVKSLCHGWMLR